MKTHTFNPLNYSYSVYQSYKIFGHQISRSLQGVLDRINDHEVRWGADNSLVNTLQAYTQSFNNLIKDYPKQDWEMEYKIVQEDLWCNLLFFPSSNKKANKSVLICAPLSGHWATLLKDTVSKVKEDYNVYITDWKNARDIALFDVNGKEQVDFGFEEYVNYLIYYIKTVHAISKQPVQAMAVCQPTVPLASAAAYLEKNGEHLLKSIILMGGPIDTRLSPTKVNDYAFSKDIAWFERNVIQFVPWGFNAVGRRVYPGYLQHLGFVSMNLQKHIKSHSDFFSHLVQGSDLLAQKHEDFYHEYNSVMDLNAKYYLQTLERVFLDQHLAKGIMQVNSQTVSLADLKKVQLLVIEGERDDISGVGQTKAAIDLAINVPKSKKSYFLAPGVGHYGIFAGKSWQNVIYPKVHAFFSRQ